MTNSISLLVVILSDVCGDDISMERGIRKLFAATSAVLGILGGGCAEEKTWRTILDRLFPVLAYGSHLWNLNKKSTFHTLDNAWRKVVRKELRMSSHDSIKERCTPGLWKLVRGQNESK